MSTERLRLHQSQINCFLRCGLQYEFRYILGLKIPPRAALTVGSSVDRAVSVNMTKKVQNQAATREEIISVASDEFDKRIAETILDDEEDAGELKDQAINLSELHFDKVAPTIDPATVQEEFILEMEGGYDLGGTLDLTDKAGYIRDTKTAKRANASGYEVFRAFQPTVYSYAYEATRGKKSAGFIFDVLKKPTKRLCAEYEKHEGQVTESDYDWLFKTTDMVFKAIQAGIALPAPEGSWACSEKFCGYYNLCKGKK